MNILQDSQPVLDGRELDRQDTENHAGGDSRKSLAQIEIQDLDDSAIDEETKPISHGLQHGAGHLHSEVPAASAKGVREWRQRLAERAAEIDDVGVWLDVALGKLGHGVAHHFILRNRAPEHVVEDGRDASVELPVPPARKVSETAVAHGGLSCHHSLEPRRLLRGWTRNALRTTGYWGHGGRGRRLIALARQRERQTSIPGAGSSCTSTRQSASWVSITHRSPVSARHSGIRHRWEL